MSEICDRSFGEDLLSGFIDEVLRQGDRQRVQLHLEVCRDCRSTVDEMTQIRDAARSTRFLGVLDSQWDETPTSPWSRWSRNAGWALLFGVLVLLLVLFAVRPDSLDDRTVETVMVWGSIGGVAGLFASALTDRLSKSATDIYREVKKLL